MKWPMIFLEEDKDIEVRSVIICTRCDAPEPSPRRSAPQPSPRRQQNNPNQNYVSEQVGKTRRDSLGIFNLPNAATEREIKVQYRRLARIYHPDKYVTTNEMTKMEAQEHFKLINNAYEFLGM